MDKKIVITGGAGFVGVNLAIECMKSGYMVTIIDLSDRDSRLKYIEKEFREKLHIIYADLWKENIVLPLDTAYIIHLAAWPHVDFSYYYPKVTLMNNTMSFVQILDEAVKKNIPVIFASSVEVYGGVRDERYSECDNPNPVSPYGASKQACELILSAYVRCYGLKAATFRLTNLYGPFQLPDRIVPRVIARLLSGMFLEVECNVVRDFLYVKDAARAIIKVMESGNWGQTYNISTGYGVSMGDIVNQILKESGIEAEVHKLDEQIQKQRGKSLIISNDKIKSELGWKPEVGLSEGIHQTYQWYSANQAWYQIFQSCYSELRDSQKFVVDCVFNDQLNRI